MNWPWGRGHDVSLFKLICYGGLNRERYWKVMDYAREQFQVGHRLLEVGSDDGAFAVGFAMLGYDVTALDPVSNPSLTCLYRFKQMTLDYYYTREEDNEAFELIHLGEVLEHCSEPDQMMEQACELCVGKLIVSVPDFEWEGHLQTYTRDQTVEFVGPYMDIDWVYEITHPHHEGTQTLIMGEPKGGG